MKSQDGLELLNISKEKGELEGLQYFASLIDELKKYKIPFDSESIHELILKMSVFCDENCRTCIVEICDKFIEQDGMKLIYHFLNYFVEEKIFLNKTLDSILKWFVSFSDYSERFAIYLESSNVFKLLTDLMLKNFFEFNLKNKESDKIFEQCLMILYNVSRNPHNKVIYRCMELKKLLVELIKLKPRDQLGVVSLLILSYIVNKDEIHFLDEGSNTIGKLIQKIKLSIKDDKRIDGLTSFELINGLYHISSNDKMKIKIETEDGIPTLIKILKRKKGKELKPTLGIFENLCFDEEIKVRLVRDHQIEEILNTLKDDERESVKKRVDCILFKIKERWISNQNEQNMKKEISCRQCDFDIFLSYSSENKQQVSEIVENLNLCGFRVWIDKKQIKGYSIKAMANGIDNSRLFIMAISTSYQLSPNCYHEAEYAFHNKKPIIPVIVEFNYKPKNWLAFIIGSKVYYEISGRKDIKREMEKLKEEIDSYLQKDNVPQTAMMEENNDGNFFSESVKKSPSNNSIINES